jgi:hypothetical protein
VLEQFYQDTLPQGQHVVATLDGKKIQHYVVNSTEEIIPFLKNFPEHNTYHSVGAYEGLTSGKLHEVKGLEGCVAAKAFGFDLDVGDDPTKYDSLEEAFDDLTRCITEGHLPEPRWTVYSGGGLQFYLVLGGDADIDGLQEEAWTSRFQQLRTHLSQHLKIDRTVGSHPYRLLRSPCTANWKYGEPVMPEILNEEPGPHITLEWMDEHCEEAKPVPKVERSDDASLNCDQPVHLKRVLKACAAMREQYKTKGAKTSYPVWLATGNICAHTFDFRKGFHHLSKDHPDYDQQETDDKFNEIVNNTASGPFGCDHFGNVDDPESPCHGCWANKAGLGNPVSAARQLGKKPAPKKEERRELLDEVAEIEEEELNEANNYGIPDHHLPEDTHTDGTSLLNDDGPVCDHFWVKPMQFNEDRAIGNILVSADREHWFPIAAKKLSMPNQLTGELLNIGVMVYQDKETMMYVRQAGLMDEMTIESSRFGWNAEFTSAYLPTGVIGKIPTEPSHDLIRLKDKWGSQKGTLKGWLKAIEIYGRPGQEAYLMTLLASLASPLLAYHNLEKGVIMSLTGQGGTGKTTALKAASSIWGSPLSTLSSMSSTFVATRIYLGLCGNLPMILDEVTQMASEDLKQFALEISQGLGRERGTKEASLAHSEEWQLNCLTTSNVSVHGKLAELVDVGSADMNRVIELPVVQSEHVSLQQGNDLLEGIRKHHGHLGDTFLRHLMTKDIEKERKQFSNMLKALRAKDGLQGRDRFADSLIASCYWAHKRVKEVVPTFPGDPDVQFLWMRKQLQQNNRFIKDVLTVRIPDADDFIMEFLQESLILSKMGDKGYPESGQSLKGYIYDHDEWVVIPKSTLDRWCKNHQLKPRTVLERWGQSGRLKNMGPEDGQMRWSGKMKSPIMIDGKKKYPTVTMMHKGQDYEQSNADPGVVENNTVSFADSKRRLRR